MEAKIIELEKKIKELEERLEKIERYNFELFEIVANTYYEQNPNLF